ncbi:MAG TPA: hypothetical protein VGR95_18950, partial [Thermoanaerobaculia bacterium]|nr:hypothetical protein [Thermoanaerobaculia bacterium]
MQKRIALLLLLLLALPASAAHKAKAAPPAPPAVSVDGHEDTPSEYLKSPFDLGVVNKRGSIDYPRMKEGG